MTWEIDPFHSLVEFSVWHLRINIVKGRFQQIRGTIYLDTNHPTASWVKAQVDASSIETGVAVRDRHLKSADFFEVASYPTIAFESTSIQQTGARSGIVTGQLTLHGATQTVQFQTEVMGTARDPQTGGWRIGISAVTTLDRRMFNIFTQSSGGGALAAMVGNEAQVVLHLEAVRT
jgi:polyisoprenoid-binding protein YceI